LGWIMTIGQHVARGAPPTALRKKQSPRLRRDMGVHATLYTACGLQLGSTWQGHLNLTWCRTIQASATAPPSTRQPAATLQKMQRGSTKTLRHWVRLNISVLGARLVKGKTVSSPVLDARFDATLYKLLQPPFRALGNQRQRYKRCKEEARRLHGTGFENFLNSSVPNARLVKVLENINTGNLGKTEANSNAVGTDGVRGKRKAMVIRVKGKQFTSSQGGGESPATTQVHATCDTLTTNLADTAMAWQPHVLCKTLCVGLGTPITWVTGSRTQLLAKDYMAINLETFARTLC